MKLSVIIVNYNVKFFLEQCLLSVRKACEQLATINENFSSEVYVVDNNSVDSSISMLEEKFPEVILLKNDVNKGFSAANNQALEVAKGEYLLLLNPDTVIEETTFSEIITFMDQHPDAGGLGVKMIDGSGAFLPESKRGLPNPKTAFYKIFGLSALFPKSRKFGKYHLGYLDKNEINEVEVLSGAFMLLRKSVIDKIGFLDESFFMYGEDIDLSYRIIKAGYKNYYFPLTQIIHYKGESTKKSSVNYVFTFYRAMIIFASKHFSSKNAKLFSFLINLAIYFRASISIFRRVLQKAALPIADFITIFGGLYIVKLIWESNLKFGHGRPYPKELVLYIFPIYILIWMLSLLSTKAYRKPFFPKNILRGVLLGTLTISAFYAFFEESFRFSRAIIILGTFTSFIITYINRIVASYIENKNVNLTFTRENRIVIIGSVKEGERVHNLLQKSSLQHRFVGFVYPVFNDKKGLNYLGNIEQINEIVKIHKVDELIFCGKDIPSSRIIKTMSLLENKDVVYKIAPDESYFIIGSHSKNNSGDLYTIDIRLELATRRSKVNKRFFDIGFSFLLLIGSVFFILKQQNKKAFFKNIFNVLIGRKTIVGYTTNARIVDLPALKPSILTTAFLKSNTTLSSEDLNELNLLYARDYSVKKDLIILKRGIKKLGN
ncbi:MAG: glycosyltransferase [Bacteroidetes bacterium]|nr:glycosyltransferase [Bacteroidota bacterium]